VGYLLPASGKKVPITGSARWEGQTLVYEQQYPKRNQGQVKRIIRYLRLQDKGNQLSSREEHWIEGKEEMIKSQWDFTRIGSAEACNAASCSFAIPAASKWYLSLEQKKQYQYGVDPKMSYTNQVSTYLKSKPGTKGEAAGLLIHSLGAGSFKGQRVRFSAFVKSERVESHDSEGAWAGLWMRIDGVFPGTKGTTQMALDDMHGKGLDRSIKGTQDWRNYSVVLDVPETGRYIAFGILLSGPGAVWISGERLERVGADVPVTAGPTPPPANGPANLSFEKTVSVQGVAARAACASGSQTQSPEAWGFGGDGKVLQYDCRIDPAASYDGRPSVSIKSKPGVAPSGFGLLVQDFKVTPYIGKRVHLSANLKSEGVDGWGGLLVNVGGSDSLPVAFDNMHDGVKDRSIKGTTAWKNYSVVLDVPKSAREIIIGAMLVGSGAMWVNGVNWEVVGPEFPVTGSSWGAVPEPGLQTKRYIKDGNVIQDPDAPISLRLTSEWALRSATRYGNNENTLAFEEIESQITMRLYYQNPSSQPRPADTETAMHNWLVTRRQQERKTKPDFRIRPDSQQKRVIGGHPALSFIADYTDQGQARVQYTVRVLGKTSRGHFAVDIPATDDIVDFVKRFDPIVNSLQIP
jgi:hypothetical protein